MRSERITGLTVFLVALLAAAAIADVPQNMNVQGRLTDASGDPVADVLVDFTFKIFDAEVGGSEIWPAGPGELQALSTDANGLWNARVGAFTPLTDGVFADSSRWLEVTVEYNAITETLPRIKLNKGPYTSDQYVNTSGDVMTGRLYSPWSHVDDGLPNIDVQNENSANYVWTEGTVGVSSFVTGNGSETKWGVVGLAYGDNGSIVGLYGQAGGFSTERYSGYFAQGDFLVQNPATPGDLAVQLPDSSISSSEILDEPGIAFNTDAVGLFLTPSTTAQDILTVTLTTPSAGYIVVRGSVTFRYSGTTGANFAWAQIDETAAGGFLTRWVWSGAFAHAGSSNEYETATITRIFNLGAGVHTFRLEGNAYISNTVGAITQVYQSELMATYYPTSYGTVSALVADRSEFEDATLVSVEDPQSGHRADVYSVDLRELELKVKRAELETERARRELVEAKLRQSGPVRNETTISTPHK